MIVISKNKIKGLCVSPGTAKGKVLNLYAGHLPIQNNEDTIIVVYKLERDLLVNLDPNIIGVVAEIGNIGSHGAGILRQLKIPCVLRIPHVTKMFKDGDIIEIDGATNTVIVNSEQSKVESGKSYIHDLKYSTLASDKFGFCDIRTNDFWIKPRPDRKYQTLRYDMIADFYTGGTSYLYHIESKTRHASDGTLEVFGIPTIESLCIFQLCNPSWFIEKAKERSFLFRKMIDELHRLAKTTDPNRIYCVINIFRRATLQYQKLFQYMFLTQLHSDQFIELYLDFIECLTGERISKDVLSLKSDYVKNCITSKKDPGVFQKWEDSLGELYVWEGEIDYTPFLIDEEIVSKIRNRIDNPTRMMRDYNSFRVIVPLIYQLSEEFFYMSKSINGFLNWSMKILFTYLNETLKLNYDTISTFYDLLLITIDNNISLIQGGN